MQTVRGGIWIAEEIDRNKIQANEAKLTTSTEVKSTIGNEKRRRATSR